MSSKYTSDHICKRCRLPESEHDPCQDGCPDKPMWDFIKPSSKGGHPRFHEIVQAMSDLFDKKNTDFTAGTVEGPLGNFIRMSQIMRLYSGIDWASPFGVCMAFMLKQFDAGLTLKAQGRASVTGEPVAARLMDIAVYTVLGIILDEAETQLKDDYEVWKNAEEETKKGS